MFAIRAARAFTGRSLVAKFDHAYHGTHDTVQAWTPGRPGRGLAPGRRAAVGRRGRRRAHPRPRRARRRRDRHRTGPGSGRRPRRRSRRSWPACATSRTGSAPCSCSTRSSPSGSGRTGPRAAWASGPTSRRWARSSAAAIPWRRSAVEPTSWTSSTPADRAPSATAARSTATRSRRRPASRRFATSRPTAISASRSWAIASATRLTDDLGRQGVDARVDGHRLAVPGGPGADARRRRVVARLGPVPRAAHRRVPPRAARDGRDRDPRATRATSTPSRPRSPGGSRRCRCRPSASAAPARRQGRSSPCASSSASSARIVAGRAVGDDPARRPSRPSAGTPRRRGACRGSRPAASAAARAARPMSSRRPRGSRPADGSSNTSTLGSIDSTVASATRLRWPRLSRCGIRRSKPAMPDRGQGALDAAVDLGLGDAHVQRPERDVVEHGRAEQLVVGILEHEPDLGADPPDRRPVDDASRRSGPSPWRRLVDAVEVEHQRALAGAVRPDQRDLLAGARSRGRCRAAPRSRPGSGSGGARARSQPRAGVARRPRRAVRVAGVRRGRGGGRGRRRRARARGRGRASVAGDRRHGRGSQHVGDQLERDAAGRRSSPAPRPRSPQRRGRGGGGTRPRSRAPASPRRSARSARTSAGTASRPSDPVTRRPPARSSRRPRPRRGRRGPRRPGPRHPRSPRRRGPRGSGT